MLLIQWEGCVVSGLYISRGEKGFDTDGFSHAGNKI